MSKESYVRHVSEVSGLLPPSAGGSRDDWRAFQRSHGPTCSQCRARQRTVKANRYRAERDACMRDIGMVKVRGSVSGSVYWE